MDNIIIATIIQRPQASKGIWIIIIIMIIIIIVIAK